MTGAIKKLSENQVADILVAINGRSGNVRVDCPLCSGGQSKTMSIDTAEGVYHCHRCGASGKLKLQSGGSNNAGALQPLSKLKIPSTVTDKITYILKKSSPAISHEYLAKKGVKPYGIRVYKDCLLIPLSMPCSQNIQSLQFINPDGKKRLLKDASKKGACFVLGELTAEKPKIYLCEGFATAGSIFQALAEASPVVVCVDASNLKSVAVKIRKKLPSIEIVFCADNDRQHPPSNPGFDKGYKAASEAALAVGGRVVMPTKAGQDFNDLMQSEGTGSVRRIIELGVDPGPPANTDDRPVIQVYGGELHLAVDEAESILLQSGEPIFSLDGQYLVRPIERPPEKRNSIHRPPGSVILFAVTVQYLVELLTQKICWQKLDARSGNFITFDCPQKIAETLLARAGKWRFPNVTGICQCPVIRPDGSILEKNGYDQQTGLYVALNSEFPKIPRNPDKAEAETALSTLRKAFSTYRFENEVSESVAIAAMITAVVRPGLDLSPLFLISAAVAGSGKSQLVDGCCITASGYPASVTNGESKPEEMQAELDSLLLEGAGFISVDNIEKPLSGSRLCQLITQNSLSVRIKGKSKTVKISPACVLFSTGNNAIVTGDLIRRTVVCNINTACERPEHRAFDMSFPDYCRIHRPELVKSVLTIVRAYAVAGAPGLGLMSTGSFEVWSRWVRSPLVWLGMPDPWESQEELRSDDSGLLNLVSVLDSWWNSLWEEPYTVKAVINQCEGANTESVQALRDALETVASSKTGGLDARKLGNYLRKNRNRIAGGFKVIKDGTLHSAVQWKVVHI